MQPFEGPKNESIVAFWPLNEEYGLLEMTTGMEPPVEVNVRRFKTSTLSGPFTRPLNLHSPYSNGDWIADYQLSFSPYPLKFTLILYIYYQNFVERVDFLIPLFKLGRLTVAYQENENKVVLIRDNFTPAGEAYDVTGSSDSNWKFLAMVYDSETVKFFNPDGKIIATTKASLEFFNTVPIFSNFFVFNCF